MRVASPYAIQQEGQGHSEDAKKYVGGQWQTAVSVVSGVIRRESLGRHLHDVCITQGSPQNVYNSKADNFPESSVGRRYSRIVTRW